MGRNWNPCTLFLGILNGAATMENSLGFSQLNIELLYDAVIPHLDTHTPNTHTHTQNGKQGLEQKTYIHQCS